MNRCDPPEPGPGVGPVTELADRLDEKVVSLPCYEPAGLQIDFVGRALVTHTLILGQTGSGKTLGAVRWFIKDLIHHHPNDSQKKAAVFIFDLNGDDTLPLVRKWAAEAGRSDDVRLLTPTTGYLDLFANVRSFEELSFATAQFMHGTWCRDGDNGYWADTARSLIDAALSICLVVTGRLETDTVIRFMTNWLVAKRPTKDDEILLQNFDAICAKAADHLDKHLLGKLELVRATIEMWAKLDGKTKGILNSCLLDAVGPLISLETRRYLDSSKRTGFVPEDLDQGRIMVFSVEAGRNIEAAALLGRLIKARLYSALQSRSQDRNQRFCAILADEYHYLASGGKDRSSDVTALATLRSRSVALVAGTQSLDHLASTMTARELRSLLPNFGNHIFFRSTEANTSAFATLIMGTREKTTSSEEESGDTMVGSTPTKSREPVCPPGALASLEPFQAYVSLSTGYRSPGMVWLGPNHETPGVFLTRNPTAAPDPLAKLRDSVFPPPQEKSPSSVTKDSVVRAEWPYSHSPFYYDESTWYRLLNERRFQRTPYPTFRAFRQALANWGHRPEGLESLPICWWEAVITMTISFGQQHPMKLLALVERKGCLEVMISDLTDPAPLYLEWIARLQCSIYPTRTRPLKRRDQRIIAQGVGDEFIFDDDAAEDEKAGGESS